MEGGSYWEEVGGPITKRDAKLHSNHLLQSGAHSATTLRATALSQPSRQAVGIPGADDSRLQLFCTNILI